MKKVLELFNGRDKTPTGKIVSPTVIRSVDRKWPKLISLEGNIGAGKTTLLKKLAALPNVHIVLEPVAVWQEIGLLKAFYQDMDEYINLFQTFVIFNLQHLYLEAIEKAPADTKYIIFERSINSGVEIFSSLFTLAPSYRRLAEEVLARCKYDLFIFLDTPADVCKTRIIERGVAEEQSISLEYLQKLTVAHFNALSTKSVLKIDNSIGVEVLLQSIDRVVKKMSRQSQPMWYTPNVLH